MRELIEVKDFKKGVSKNGNDYYRVYDGKKPAFCYDKTKMFKMFENGELRIGLSIYAEYSKSQKSDMNFIEFISFKDDNTQEPVQTTKNFDNVEILSNNLAKLFEEHKEMDKKLKSIMNCLSISLEGDEK